MQRPCASPSCPPATTRGATPLSTSALSSAANFAPGHAKRYARQSSVPASIAACTAATEPIPRFTSNSPALHFSATDAHPRWGGHLVERRWLLVGDGSVVWGS